MEQEAREERVPGDAEALSPPRPEVVLSGWLRALFALIPPACLFAWSRVPGIPDGGGLLFLGLGTFGLGMALPWARFFRFNPVDPGLRFPAKVTGWLGACLLPFALVVGSWTGSAACLFGLWLSWGTLRRHRWSLWLWRATVLRGFIPGS